MNRDKEFHLFISSLDDDITIGKNHLIDDLPGIFAAPDFLYFFALRDYFWADVEIEERLMISVAMAECYLSALLHISSGEYHFDETNHHLEHCILYGDLLSGAFSEKLILMNRVDMLEEWLNLLQDINKELLSFSLEGKSTLEKKVCLVEHLIAALAKSEDTEKLVENARQLLVENTVPKEDQLFSDKNKSFFASIMGEPWTSAQDLKTLREQVNP